MGLALNWQQLLRTKLPLVVFSRAIASALDPLVTSNYFSTHWKRELKKLKLRDIPGNAEPEVLPEVPDEELKEVDEKQWQYELNLMEEKLGTMNVNYAIIEEYNRKEALYMGKLLVLKKDKLCL